MKIYVGFKLPHNKRTVLVRRLAQDQSVLSEKPLYHFERHSPDGFTWGMTGAGAQDLALSILFNHMRAEPDRHLYHLFKDTFVSNFESDQWSIASDEIDRWLESRLAHGEKD